MRGGEATISNASMTLCMPLLTGTNDQMTAHEYGMYRPFSILRGSRRKDTGLKNFLPFCIAIVALFFFYSLPKLKHTSLFIVIYF